MFTHKDVTEIAMPTHKDKLLVGQQLTRSESGEAGGWDRF